MVEDGYEFSISGAAFHACGFIAGSWTMSLQLLKLLDVERSDDSPPFHAGRFFSFSQFLFLLIVGRWIA